ncbi:hypothetical protein [Mycolicibacterium litorale]|nr:hypothetical protein [Mycolicibacterium litorale]
MLVRPDGYIAWAGKSADRPAWAAALPVRADASECGCPR